MELTDNRREVDSSLHCLILLSPGHFSTLGVRYLSQKEVRKRLTSLREPQLILASNRTLAWVKGCSLQVISQEFFVREYSLIFSLTEAQLLGGCEVILSCDFLMPLLVLSRA